MLTVTRLTFKEAHNRWVLWAIALMGVAMIALFATGFFFVHREFTSHMAAAGVRPGELFEVSDFFLLAGLYAVDFLVVVLAVLTSVDIISGEVASGTIHTIVTKPLRRWEIVLGKWLGLATMLSLFAVAMCLAIMLVVWVIAGYTPRNPVPGIALIALEGIIILSVSILGGTRLSTLTNGVVVFMLYGLAFIGGWIEQFGFFLRNEAAVNIGIAISLVMPGEAMWKLATYLMEPPAMRVLGVHPLSAVSPPSGMMVAYSVLFVVATLGAAVYSFERRDL